MRDDWISAMVCAVAFMAASSAVAARPALQNIPVIEDGLFAVAVADKIRRECDTISGRIWQAQRVLQRLYSVATETGYSRAEIEAYVASKEQQNRMRVRRDRYLAGQGVVKSEPASYCAAGQAEIETSSQIGALLKAR